MVCRLIGLEWGGREKSLEAEIKELTARIDAMGKIEEVQNGPGISFKEEGDLD